MEKNVFNEWYTALSKKDRVYYSNVIRYHCHISSSVLSHWKAGDAPIREIYRGKINEIVGFKLFNDEAIR